MHGVDARAPQRIGVGPQDTAFGRLVVPLVYCTLQGASGSGARRGGGSASRVAKRWSAGTGWAAGVPLSVSVTTCQRMCRQLRATASANFGWVMAATAPLCSA
jgi:3-oxoacyl-ACP reductase-like protein